MYIVNYDTGECAPRYTISYEGHIFADDTDGWNSFDEDDFTKAMEFYHAYTPQGLDVYVEDNEYGVTFHNNEWF